MDDDDLADRIRRILADDPNIGEVRMFGGLCFMLNGNMLVCTTRDSGLLARIGEQAMPEAVKQPGVTTMTMGGRDMKAYAHVPGERLDDTALLRWIAVATSFVGPMPPKAKADKGPP